MRWCRSLIVRSGPENDLGGVMVGAASLDPQFSGGFQLYDGL